ncbi:alanine racemase [Paenibacillus sp. GSMTC-2017]|uniref:alanine racemase n=1 Tax=Paenibacillus sp. GSMTC-2017 TaxID=2794350 RepID=UPI0018D66472|nr:alanine racemase [Paenibacillus sp. GSMTC-2017]MBH5320114.1 alanine racemase [Paenibacillus sp. GSMTC-2017]
MSQNVTTNTIFETPCVVINSDIVDSNIQKIAETINATGVKLRPHAKTHKMPEMALRQLKAGAIGITVAKIAEAEVMAEGGIKDIFVAYPIVSTSKLERAAKLVKSGIRLIIGVDSIEGAKRISTVASEQGVTLEVRLEIESGLNRTGVEASSAAQLAKAIASLEAVSLNGIFTYRGAMLSGAPTMDLRAAGHEEGTFMVSVAQSLRDAGLTIKDVSVGSSPTAIYAAEIAGITEVRPGTYIYQDRMQAAFDICSFEECAGAVWATVVSRPTSDRIVIDGGSKTFATDVQPDKAPLNLKGFGHIVGDDDAVFERMNEEHGVIRVNPASDYQIGDVIAIIPNHICSTVNLHSFIYLQNSDGELTKVAVAARGLLE